MSTEPTNETPTTSPADFDIVAFKARAAEGQARWRETGECWTCSAEELKQAYISGERNLYAADLSAANLSRANLYAADLSDANLSRADLSDANLSRANLSRANLSDADLSAANLSRANLYAANLYAADLSRAELNWNSHNLIAEILFRAAESDLLKQSFALLIRQHVDWCWNVWLADTAPRSIEQAQWDALVVANRAWALSELAKWVKDGDNAPAAVRAMAEQQADATPE